LFLETADVAHRRGLRGARGRLGERLRILIGPEASNAQNNIAAATAGRVRLDEGQRLLSRILRLSTVAGFCPSVRRSGTTAVR
jgi:hypothetical protein